MVFNLSELIAVGIPVFLHNRKDYYVKGGRVYDTYFKNTTNSIDWDINGTEGFDTYLRKFLLNIADKNGLNLMIKENSFIDHKLVQYGFRDLFYDDSLDPYFIDVIIGDDLFYDTIDGINYMTLIYFVSDLVITQGNRLKQAKRYAKSNPILLKGVDIFNETYDTSIDICGKNVYQVLKETLPFLYTYTADNSTPLVNDIITKSILDKLDKLPPNSDYDTISKILASDDPEEILDNTTHTDEDEEDMSSITNFLSMEYGDDIISNVNALCANILESKSIYRKYLKTRKRYENVIDINWDNISDKYKIFLMNHCKEVGDTLTLFEINDTCKSILDCNTNTINDYRENCLDNQNEFEEFDRYISRDEDH